MIDFKTIKRIFLDANTSMKKDSDDEKISSCWKNFVFILVFYILPIGVSVVAWYKNILLSNLENYIGASLAIFTGLFFSLLLSIGDKIRQEKENSNMDALNFQRFKTSMKQIAHITLLIIVYGVVIFLILLINSIAKIDGIPIVEKCITVVALFLLTQYTVSLFFMLQRFYFVIKDEIGNIL